jgi:hypothetical protein
MDRMIRRFILFFVLAGALAGCSSQKGQLNGQLISPGQSAAAPVTMEFQSDRSGTAGKISTTLPNGESFTGNYVQITSATEESSLNPFWSGWSPYWSDWNHFGDPWVDGPGFATFRTNYSNRVVATLFGNRGGTMRCRLDLKSPRKGMASGGAGECQTSKRERIDVQF